MIKLLALLATMAGLSACQPMMVQNTDCSDRGGTLTALGCQGGGSTPFGRALPGNFDNAPPVDPVGLE